MGLGRGHYTPPAKGMHICARKLEIILNENIAENHNYMSSKWLSDFELDFDLTIWRFLSHLGYICFNTACNLQQTADEKENKF